MTTSEDLRQIVYQVYDAVNAQDMERLEALFDPQIVRHAMNEVGFEAARDAALKAFADGVERRLVVEDVIVEGDRAALRVTIRTPTQAPDQPTPIILEIFRFRDGRVAEIWGAGGTQRPAP